MRQCNRKVARGRRIPGAIRSLFNAARSLQFECASVLHESLLVPVLTYGSETMIWRLKKTVYGLKDASRACYRSVVGHVQNVGSQE